MAPSKATPTLYGGPNCCATWESYQRCGLDPRDLRLHMRF